METVAPHGPVSVLWCSKKKVPRGWETHEHRHLYQQLTYVLEGSLKVSVDRSSYRLTKNDCVLIDSAVLHRLQADNPCKTIDLKFVVHNQDLSRAVSSVPPYRPTPPPKIKHGLIRLMQEAQTISPYRERILGAITEILLYDLALMQDGDQQVDRASPPTRPTHQSTVDHPKDSPELVLAVIQYFEKHYANEISLDGLGRELGYNPTYICERFSAIVGRPPIRYLTEYRIQMAQDLLANTSTPVSDVSWKVGFKSTSHFSRAFRDIVGKSPNEYRKSAQAPPNIEYYFVEKSIVNNYLP